MQAEAAEHESRPPTLARYSIASALFVGAVLVSGIFLRPTYSDSGAVLWRPEIAFSCVGLSLVGWSFLPVVALALLVQSLSTPVLGANAGYVVADTGFGLLAASAVAAGVRSSYRRRDWGAQRDVFIFLAATLGASLLLGLLEWIFVGKVSSDAFLIGCVSAGSALLAIVPISLKLNDYGSSSARSFKEFFHGATPTGTIVLQYLAIVAVALFIRLEQPNGSSQSTYPLFIPVFWMALTGGLAASAGATAATHLLLIATFVVSPSAVDRVLAIQIAAAVLGTAALLAGSVVSDRQQITEQLAERERLLQKQLAESQVIRSLSDSIVALEHESTLYKLGADAMRKQLECDWVSIISLDSNGTARHCAQTGREPNGANKMLVLHPLWHRLSIDGPSIVSHRDSVAGLLQIGAADVVIHGELGISSVILHPFSRTAAGALCAVVARFDSEEPFGPEDATFVGAVCDQVTLALQKTRLLAERDERSRAFERMSQALVAETGESFFTNLVVRLSETIGSRVAYIVQSVDGGENGIPMAFVEAGELKNLPKYRLTGTPSEDVMKLGSVALADGAFEIFPRLGEIFKVECRGFAGIALSSSRGEVLGTLCVLHDGPLEDPDHIVSVLRLFGARAAAEIERVQRERLIRESEASLRRILETAHEGIVILDADGKIAYANPEIAAMLGYAVDDLMDQTIASFVAENEAGKLTIAKVAGGVAERVDCRLRRRDGSLLWAMVSINPIPAEGGGVQGTLAMFSNITSRKEQEELLEERVRQRTAELQASNHELEAFCYSISHDLRQPLRAIDGFSRALLEDMKDVLDSESEGHLQRVRRATIRMSEIIDALLTLSKLSRVEMSRTNIDLTAMAETILQEFTEGDSAPGFAFSVRPNMRCKGDERLIRIALHNLISNALKFCSKKPEPFVEVGYGSEGGRTGFFVKDNGVGFDMAYSKKLFQPFERLHSEAEYQGTGIGLATVQRIIHRHGGEIWGVGEPGKGAAFYFTVS